MLERAEIAQAGPAIPKDAFAAAQRFMDISGQQLLENLPPDTVVEQPIVAAVERPYTAEEAGVVDGDDEARQADQEKGQERPPYPEPHQRQDHGKDPGQRQTADGELLEAHAPRRREIHGERGRLDGDADNAPAGIGGLDGAAAAAGPAGEMLAGAFPQQFAAPAQFAAGIGRRQAHHFKPRHGEVPAVQAHPERTAAPRALHVAGHAPIVAELVDEAEPQPNRIGEIEFGDGTRISRLVKNPVGGKRKGANPGKP